jgi:hypothetical protein
VVQGRILEDMMLHPTFGQSIHLQRKVTFEKAAHRRRWIKRRKRIQP